MNSNYNPPSSHGLTNSEQIIPTYYFKTVSFIQNGEEKETKYLKIDYFSMIKDDIKNMRKLNKFMLNYIQYDLSDEEKNEIIILMNESINSFIDVVLKD